MGICSSCDATKVIMENGRLMEYSSPVKASYVLQNNPACFICNSDEMDCDIHLTAVTPDEELRPDHLYFALPLSRLRRRLRPEDMAALVLKASSALRKSSRNYNTLEFSCESWEAASRRRRGGDAARKDTFTVTLIARPE